MAERGATYGWERWPPRMALDFKTPLCRWCAKPLEGRKTDWCSDACRREVEVRCRLDELRHVIFARDGGCCCKCGRDLNALKAALDWFEALKLKLTLCSGMAIVDRNKAWALTNHWPTVDELRRALGFKKAHLWEMNHIVGIAEGGDPVDPDNLETLCLICHSLHTAALVGRVAKAKRLKAKYNNGQ
jgi:5-methylcytosine-specific restriction endonuclease McrA